MDPLEEEARQDQLLDLIEGAMSDHMEYDDTGEFGFTPELLTVYYSRWFEKQVSNGGFGQFFWNAYQSQNTVYLKEARKALANLSLFSQDDSILENYDRALEKLNEKPGKKRAFLREDYFEDSPLKAELYAVSRPFFENEGRLKKDLARFCLKELERSIPPRGSDPEEWDHEYQFYYWEERELVIWEELYWKIVDDEYLWLLQYLLDQGLDVNQEFTYGDLLIFAAYHDQPGCLNMLIERGARVDRDTDQDSPLLRGAQYASPEILRTLVGAGADPDKRHAPGTNHHNTSLLTALMFDRLDNAQTLLELGANPTLKDSDGKTVIHYCLKSEEDEEDLSPWWELCEKFIQAGVPVDQTDKSKHTPLHYAARYGETSNIVFLISRGADVNMEKAGGGETPLHLACMQENVDTVRALLDRGANPLTLNKQGQSPLHLATLQGAGLKKQKSRDKYRAIIRLLLEKGADKNRRTGRAVKVKSRTFKRGSTALDYAKVFGEKDFIDLLK